MGHCSRKSLPRDRQSDLKYGHFEFLSHFLRSGFGFGSTFAALNPNAMWASVYECLDPAAYLITLGNGTMPVFAWLTHCRQQFSRQCVLMLLPLTSHCAVNLGDLLAHCEAQAQPIDTMTEEFDDLLSSGFANLWILSSPSVNYRIGAGPDNVRFCLVLFWMMAWRFWGRS